MKRSSQKAGRGSPELLADALMARIFRGDFQPGERLPAERQLALQLKVDRTTLRMALKQLSRMNLIAIRHGSGIEVNDFRVSGGLDALAAMFALEEVPLEGSFIIEALDFWLEIFGLTAAKAIVRMSLDDMRALERILDSAIEAKSVDDLVAASMELQDALARLSGSVLLRMLNNSTESLRERITRLLPETIDAAASFAGLKTMLRTAALSRPSEQAAHAALVEALKTLTGKLRERLLFGTPVGTTSRKRRRTGGGKDST